MEIRVLEGQALKRRTGTSGISADQERETLTFPDAESSYSNLAMLIEEEKFSDDMDEEKQNKEGGRVNNWFGSFNLMSVGSAETSASADYLVAALASASSGAESGCKDQCTNCSTIELITPSYSYLASQLSSISVYPTCYRQSFHLLLTLRREMDGSLGSLGALPIGWQSLSFNALMLICASSAFTFPVDGEGLAKKLVSEEKWKTKLFGLNLNLT
ncbi:unnamed protein product [Lupinus luteus]|uniref:Uncharacterized protein n=1 Tax=Lupinus luteus TaxID=3873 RepID=A0AAV1WVS2_LUPLU